MENTREEALTVPVSMIMECAGDTKALVILSALASIELHETSSRPELPQHTTLVKVPCDGLCFYYCLWLALQATPAQLFSWTLRTRNACGIPAQGEYQEEKQNALLWALDLQRMANRCMPRAMRRRISECQCAEQADLAPCQYGLRG